MPDAFRRGAASELSPESFIAIYGLAFVRPSRAMHAMLQRPLALRFGGYSVAIAGCAYTLVYFFLSHNGGRPTVFEPWLAIPAEVYYRYNLLLHVPSLLLSWVAAAGFTHLFARRLGGTGSFERTLAGLGLGIGVAFWTTGLHDLVTTFSGYVGTLDQRAYEDAMSSAGNPAHYLIWSLMGAYLVAFLLLFTRAIQAAHALSWWRALVSGSLAFGVYQLIFLLFNR